MHALTEDVVTPTTDNPGQSEQSARAIAWAIECFIVFIFYYVYQTIRRFANHGGVTTRAFRNSNYVVQWEQWLHIYNEQALQSVFLGSDSFIKIVNIYYGTLHFMVTAGLLGWLFAKRHAVYKQMRNLLGLTTALALIGYWSFPLAPPRMRGWDGFVDTLDTVGGLWSYESPVAKAVANPFAAMPSLHFGWSLWCAAVLWMLSTRRSTKYVAVAYPLLTLFAIVVTANHFWLDAVGGAIIFVAAIFIIRGWHTMQSRRISRRAHASRPQEDLQPVAVGASHEHHE